MHLFGVWSKCVGYKLYDPVTKKVVRSRDVMFMEDQTIQDVDKTEQIVTESYDDIVDAELIQVAPVNIPDEHEMQDDLHNEQEIQMDDDVQQNDEVQDDIQADEEVAEDVLLRQSSRNR